MSILNGKSLIITGGASGIGEAAALSAASVGARITIADVNQAAGDALVKRIRTQGGEAQFIRTDISDEEQVKAMVDASVSAYCRLDGAFNNAGVPASSHQGNGAPFLLFADLPMGKFRRGIDINLCGTFLCMKYESQAMLKTTSLYTSLLNT